MPQISLNPYSYRDRHAIVERARLRGLASWARADRQDLHRAYLDLLTALANLKAAGIKDEALFDDVARGFYDAISERDAALRDDIDGEYAEPLGPLNPAEPLDLTDLTYYFTGEGR